ncbi:hypothetical protein [Neobacillus sp.]|uniref:hypothetical protein n=1 Tax=Neobacillus sp. TaxID=2675273 RepID=UPI0037C7D444
MLVRQQAESQKEDVTDPVEGEIDYLFVITDNERVHSAFKEIVDILFYLTNGGVDPRRINALFIELIALL